ncbi:hypothetical protein PAMA_003322 [Pampus argenteus]
MLLVTIPETLFHLHQAKSDPTIVSRTRVQAYHILVLTLSLRRQHNDARMNLAIALTAARYGAAIAYYTEVVHLLKRADPQTGKERVCRVHCRDVITGQEFDVRAKCVINATGPFTNALWKMDDQKNPDICQPGAGVHIVIPGYYRPKVNAVFLFVPFPAPAPFHAHYTCTPSVLTTWGSWIPSHHLLTDLGEEAQTHPDTACLLVEEDINFKQTEVHNYLSQDLESDYHMLYTQTYLIMNSTLFSRRSQQPSSTTTKLAPSSELTSVRLSWSERCLGPEQSNGTIKESQQRALFAGWLDGSVGGLGCVALQLSRDLATLGALLTWRLDRGKIRGKYFQLSHRLDIGICRLESQHKTRRFKASAY